MAETYTPTTGMASAAKRALQWHADGKPGGTAVGLARANQLKDREPLSEDTVLRMFSFFSRHEVDKQATGFSSGEEGFPSKGRVAWDMWGGDGGFSWSREKRDHIMNAREGKSLSKKDLSMDELNKAVLAAFASEFSFYLKTHGFHWNTTGKDFYEYHLLFERIYSDVYESIDPFAENIRTLQVFVPASLSGLMANTLVEDCADSPPPTKEEMVAELIDDNDTILQLLKNAYNLCELYSKFGFQNFIADRLTAHESYGWLLRCSI
jgi:DNA-binding ferritin-like protein